MDTKYFNTAYNAVLKKDLPSQPYGNTTFKTGEKITLVIWKPKDKTEPTIQFVGGMYKWGEISVEEAEEHIICTSKASTSPDEVHNSYIRAYNRSMY